MKSNHKNFVHLVGLYTNCKTMHGAYSVKQINCCLQPTVGPEFSVGFIAILRLFSDKFYPPYHLQPSQSSVLCLYTVNVITKRFIASSASTYRRSFSATTKSGGQNSIKMHLPWLTAVSGYVHECAMLGSPSCQKMYVQVFLKWQ